MDSSQKLIIDSFGSTLIKLDTLMSEHTAVKKGGPAKIFFVAININQVIKMINVAQDLKLPCLVFGTGSKLLISDKGFNGVIIKNRTKNISIISIRGLVGNGAIGVSEALVEVESGVIVKSLVEFLNKQGLESLEFEGLPGTIGGNIFLNLNLRDKSEVINVLEYGETIQIKPTDLSLKKHIVLSIIFKFKAKSI